MQGTGGLPVSMPQVQQPQGEPLTQVQPSSQAGLLPTGAQRQPPVNVQGGGLTMQPTQPPPQLQPPGQLMRPPGPTPPQIQPYRGQQEGMQGPPGSMAPPTHAHETLYVDDIPLDMSKRELSHIFRPFGGYKVGALQALSSS
jgi:hypothetical protein